jgi:DNA-directed RNA polymerase alpha subunit
MSSLLQHLPGCSPLAPCASCQLVTFLRGKLDTDDFGQFLELSRNFDLSLKETELNRPLSDFSFAPVTVKRLQNYMILTLKDLLRKTETDLEELANFGKKTIHDIKEVLSEIGHHLGEIPQETKTKSKSA